MFGLAIILGLVGIATIAMVLIAMSGAEAFGAWRRRRRLTKK